MKKEKAESLVAVHTHTHTIMFTKRKEQKCNKLDTKDVNNTSLKTMKNKARKQYIVLRKIKLSGCTP